MRICAEVPWIGAGIPGDGKRPDLPNGLDYAYVLEPVGGACFVVVTDPGAFMLPAATWTGTEAEAIARWGLPPGMLVPGDPTRIAIQRYVQTWADVHGNP